MKLAITIAILFFLFLFAIELIRLLSSIAKYFYERVKKVKAETLMILDNKTSKPSFDITDDLISLINYMIDNEIAFRVQLLSYSKAPYQLLNLDKDIQSISQLIFDNLNKDVLSETETMVKSDYIMHFIINQVTIKLAGTMREYNLNVIMDTNQES